MILKKIQRRDSFVTYIKLFVDKPGAPENLKANNTTKSSTDLTWEAPSEDGGSPITGYYVEKMPSYSTRWSKVNKEPIPEAKLSLSDLEDKTEYKFKVAAENKAGIGPFCEPISMVAKDGFGNHSNKYSFNKK